MADFPPNLVDGELWIPSDILINDAASNYRHNDVSTVDDLSRRLEVEAIDIPKSNKNLNSKTWHNFPPNSQRCIPLANCDGVHVPLWYSSQNGELQRQICCGHGTASFFGGPKMLCEYGRRIPARPQVLGLQQTRGWFLQMQQNGPPSLQPSQSRYGYGFGGFAKGSRGTGVFHPQAVNNRVALPKNTSAKSKKKKGECSVASKRREERSAMDNQKESHPSLRLEMHLPKDWTY